MQLHAWECSARAEYERVRGMVAFNIAGAIRRRRNQHATSYAFPDGSRLCVTIMGVCTYYGTDRKPYATRDQWSTSVVMLEGGR
mgnify:FL=1